MAQPEAQRTASETGEERDSARAASAEPAGRTNESQSPSARGSRRIGKDLAEGLPAGNRTKSGAQPQEDSSLRARGREIAPAISPLIVGFTLLLVLIFLLGYLSVRSMAEVSSGVVDLGRQHTAKLSLLLQLRLAVTKLNNEARARAEAESRRQLRPPFDFRLSLARDDVNKLLQLLEKPPLSEYDEWRVFRGNLQSYVQVTEDLRRYSLEGFAKFRIVDEQLNKLLAKASAEQEGVSAESEEIKEKATKSIRLWSVMALLVGAIVAAGTMWEVQRRFRQMRLSMFEARRERVFTNQLLEGMVSAVAAIDENNRIRSANAAFFNIFPRASIGASVVEKFGSDDAMKMLDAATSVRDTKATYRGRWVCRLGENGHNEKTFDVYSSPLAIDGDQGQIVTLVDATEVAESERGLRRSESLAAVGQATAQVAHEIRNPLGSIRLGVSMLRDNVDDPEALNTIELVERGISHLNKLVVDVTQFSRQKALERSRVDLHELLDMSLDLVSESIKQKRTPVEKFFSDRPLVANWDGHQLRQVFVNLFSNAIDASRDETPITISTREVTVNEGGSQGRAAISYARIVIADQGKGIDATKLDRIFEPFFSTKKRGTGLGLAIVKQIVEQHEGRISVDSQEGKGTRFVIDLPL